MYSDWKSRIDSTRFFLGGGGGGGGRGGGCYIVILVLSLTTITKVIGGNSLKFLTFISWKVYER